MKDVETNQDISKESMNYEEISAFRNVVQKDIKKRTAIIHNCYSTITFSIILGILSACLFSFTVLGIVFILASIISIIICYLISKKARTALIFLRAAQSIPIEFY